MTWINSRSGLRQYKSVSPIYDNSRIAQSIWDAIGAEYDVYIDKCRELMSQIKPETADYLLYMWEQRYSVTPANDDLAERRSAVVSRRNFRKPISPYRLQTYLSTLARRSVTVDEHIADYTFGVYFTNERESGATVNYSAMMQVIRHLKQAHMVFELGFLTRAMLAIDVSVERKLFVYPICGTIPQANITGVQTERELELGICLTAVSCLQNITSDASYAGTYPQANIAGQRDGMAMSAECEAYQIEFTPCGTKACGE